MTEHWSWLTGSGAAEYTYSPPTRPSRPPHRPLVKLATSAHLHTIARNRPTLCDHKMILQAKTNLPQVS
ncbi:unnamed protein product [Arctia plantaginis]|uniref:Uncharacterized protein n=1 Tax=Arctia plantaginis TaxID=874455 RepID=A0A8S1BHH8_ARCPL|nr:unnamed protein product [Arctia plantaginis]